jgi:hypothetical protein
MDNAAGLGPGQVWKFSALVVEDTATSAQVTDITAIREF